MRKLVLSFGVLLLTVYSQVFAQYVVRLCGSGIQLRTPDFQPGGIILTAFDSSGIWVYDIDRSRRYPLPDTRPCGNNCRLSPDAEWITYPNGGDYIKMRLDGSQRTPLVDNANDVEWWSAETLLVWTLEHDAFLQAAGDAETREYLNVDGVVSVQPGGHWGVTVEADGEDFRRALINLDARDEGSVDLGVDVTYFNAAAWSPDGAWLVYAAPDVYDANVGVAGAELFGIRPGDSAPTQLTNLNAMYGAVRINGHAVGQLSWSPDSTRVAFWVTELLGADYLSNTGNAVIHILDVATGDLTVYCGFSTIEHTPNPPRLVWSPDGTHVAFGGNVVDDNRGYLLLALDTGTGTLTELSDGVFPVFGSPDVIAWGQLP